MAAVGQSETRSDCSNKSAPPHIAAATHAFSRGSVALQSQQCHEACRAATQPQSAVINPVGASYWEGRLIVGQSNLPRGPTLPAQG